MQDEVNTKVVAIMIKGGKNLSRGAEKGTGQVRSGDREGAEADAASQNLSRQTVHQASDEPERRHLQH